MQDLPDRILLAPATTSATLRPMRCHPATPLLCLLLILPSCGLIKLPFKVAGAVAEGGAYVGKKAYAASAAALGDSDEEKAAKAEKKARKKERKEAGEETGQAPKEDPAGPIEPPASTSGEYAPLPEESLPPLPEGS
jgi:hypothetical protein